MFPTFGRKQLSTALNQSKLYLFSGCRKNTEYTATDIYFVAAFIGSGGAGLLITSLSIVADLIGKNKESSAFVYGIMSLVDKVSNGMCQISIVFQFETQSFNFIMYILNPNLVYLILCFRYRIHGYPAFCTQTR